VHFFGEQRVFGRPSRVLVMDLLGPSLEDMSWAVSAGGPLSAMTTLMVADQALARIAAVHRAGVVHRDVKPDNLLLGNPSNRGGARTVHLVDFGLAAPGPGGGAGSSGGGGGDAQSESPTSSSSSSPAAGGWSSGGRSSSSGLEGTAQYSSAAADAGRAPTYADDLEALVFSLSYLRAGTTPWVPLELRGRAGYYFSLTLLLCVKTRCS
jgi:serine/threonine protein kinase